MAIESKNLLVWVKAMSRGKGLPLDASEVYDSIGAAETYASTSAIAYPGQTIKALAEDGKYHSYTLQPSEAGYTLEEVGAIKASDLKQYVQVVETLPTSGQEEGVLYICGTTGSIWTNSAWKNVFWDVTTDINGLDGRVDDLEGAIETKAPINNPVFTGTVKVGTEEVALKSYVDGLISNLRSETPKILNSETLGNYDYLTPGDTYRVSEAGTYWGHKCEVGDLILALNEATLAGDPASVTPDDVLVIQANIDGAVTSTADAATVGEIVVFDAVTGKVIKGSGVQIASLNDAIAKAHEHSNKAKLDTYDKTQTELLDAAALTAQGKVDALSGVVDGKLADKADKAKTLAGYGITDAYTKTDVDNKFTTVEGNLNTKISTTDAEDKIATAKSETLEEAAAAAQDLLDAYDATMTETLGGKADKATTLAGYGITDAYTKTETEDLIAVAKGEAMGAANQNTQAQVKALSDTVDGKLAEKADKATTLSGYGITDAYTTTQVDAALSGKANNATTLSGYGITDAYTKTEAGNVLEARVGDIPADTTIQSYIDTAVGSGGTASANAIAAAKQEAITTSNSYTDTQINAALTVVEF